MHSSVTGNRHLFDLMLLLFLLKMLPNVTPFKCSFSFFLKMFGIIRHECGLKFAAPPINLGSIIEQRTFWHHHFSLTKRFRGFRAQKMELIFLATVFSFSADAICLCSFTEVFPTVKLHNYCSCLSVSQAPSFFPGKNKMRRKIMIFFLSPSETV